MTPELTGLELRRKTLEAIWGVGTRFYSWNMPAVESDDGIALRELIKFCGSRLHWRVASNKNGEIECWLIDGESSVQLIRSMVGNTPAEAICRAIIAAVAEKGKS